MAEHSSLTGSSLHEPKGADSAASGALYLANGAGSGTWTACHNFNKIVLNCYMADVNTASDVYVACPIAGKVTKVYGAVLAGTTVADSAVTVKIGGVALTNGTLTVSHTTTGATAGDIVSCTPTALNTVTAGQAIQINTDGGGSTTVPVIWTILVDVT